MQDVDRVLVDVLEDDVVVGIVLAELAVVCVELDVEVEVELIGVEFVVVGVELLVVDEVVVGVDEVLRTAYALMPATTTMMITIAATTVRAIPPLFCSKKKCARETPFKSVHGVHV